MTASFGGDALKANSEQRVHVRRWPYLLTGILSMLLAGIIYAWSILKVPLGAAFGWTAAQLSLNYTLTMCFFCLGGVVSGFLIRRTSPKLVLLLAALLSCGGFLLTSGLTGSIGMLYLSYGVLGGSGIGMAYNTVIAATGAWFPDKKGLCTGALMMGFGASALILGGAAEAMITLPDVGWRMAFAVLGIAMGAVLILAALILRFPGAGIRLPTPKGPGTRQEEAFASKDYTTREMLRRPTFWRFFLFTVAMASVGSTVISFAKDLALSVGVSAALATTLVGVLSVCNGLGRVTCGALFDGLGRKRTMLAANFLAILATTLTLCAIVLGSIPLCVAGLCVTGLAYGFAPTISSAFVSAFYGQQHFAMNFSIANTMLIPASFTATLASALVASTGGYTTPFIVLLVFTLIGLALNLSIKEP